MQTLPISSAKFEARLKFAQFACVWLGIMLLFWGVAPAVTAYAVSGQVPTFSAAFANDFALLPGVFFILMYGPLKRREHWAYRVTFVVAGTLTGLSALLTVIGGGGLGGLTIGVLGFLLAVGIRMALPPQAVASAEAAGLLSADAER